MVTDQSREQQARDIAGVGQAQATLMQELNNRQMMQSGGDPKKAMDSLGLSASQQTAASHVSSQFLEQMRALASAQMTGQAQINQAQQQTAADEQGAATASSSSGGPATMGSKMTNGMGDSSNGSDDEAVMKVVQGATAGVYADLYNMVQKMENTRMQKQALTDYISVLQTALGSGKNPLKVPVYDISFDEKTGKVTMKYMGMKEMSKEEVSALKDKASGIKDSLSEMSTMDQLVLQQAMEKKGQFESIFSNMLKTYQQTAQGVLSNLK